MVVFMGFYGIYLPVSSNIAMENGPFIEFSYKSLHLQGIFQPAMLDYRMVSVQLDG